MDRARGLDVTRYQGDINWELVKADGYEFAMIRVSGPNNDRTGVEVDPRFEANYAGAGSVGLLRGGYHGLVPDFAGQAQLFVGAVGGRPLELGYWSDLENTALTDAKCQVHLEAVDARIADLSEWPTGVYTSPNFMSSRQGGWAEGRRLWLAHWLYDPAKEPIVPAQWDSWEFWQWTNQGVDVPGVPERTCLDVYDGSVADLHNAYGRETTMELKVWSVDAEGNFTEEDWAWAQERYGVRLVEATPPKGATVYRLTELRQKLGPCGMTVDVVDEDGQPLEGIVVLQGWENPEKQLPDDAAPRLSEDFWGQPEGKPNQGEGGFTNGEGVYGWGWGPGEQYQPELEEGPHWYWVMPGGEQVYSDVTLGYGWLWGSDHDTLNLTFTRTVMEDEEPPPPPVDPDLEAVVEQLTRIADAAEYMVEHWPFK